MAVKIRLARRGRKKRPIYDIVVADARAPRDGRFIQKLGSYNPNINPAQVTLNTDEAFKWVMNGAQPTDTARRILSTRGVMLKRHLQLGVNKGAITQEVADKRFEEWLNTRNAKVEARDAQIMAGKDAVAKARLDAEKKINEERQKAIDERIKAEEAAKAAAAAEAEAAKKEAEAEENAEAETETPSEDNAE